MSKGQRPFIGGILSLEEFFPVIVHWEVANIQVPEPGILLLLGAGLIALVVLGIIKRKKNGNKGQSIP
jgi:threonine dehydrogenase-like Zn-dependent dehydrogenase